MELRFKITAREIFVFSVNNYYRSVSGIVSVLCTIAALIFIVFNRERIGIKVADLLFMVILLVAVGQVFIMRQRAARQAANPVSSQEMFFKISSDGIRVRQGKETGNVTWDQVLRVKKISGIFMLYLSRNQAYLIPERAFRGAGKQRFLQLIEKNVPAKKRKGIKI